jgi:uncharacterized metal-binding protein
MNYRWHTRISLLLVTVLAIYFAYAKILTTFEVNAFWIMGYINTIYVSPDIDHQNSTPTQHMGMVGWLTSRIFTHRGLLHNPLFWTLLYAFVGYYVYSEYAYEAWFLTGGLVAIYTHLLLDCVSTKYKRTKTKIKRALHI